MPFAHLAAVNKSSQILSTNDQDLSQQLRKESSTPSNHQRSAEENNELTYSRRLYNQSEVIRDEPARQGSLS